MKKTLIATLPVAAFVAGMAVVPSVFAASDTNISTWDGLKNCLLTDEANVTCTLSDNINGADSNINIVAGKNVVLDLAGHNIDYGTGNYDIAVKQGSSLEIKGTGNITSENSLGNSGHSMLYVMGNTADAPTKLTIGSGVNIKGSTSVLNVYVAGNGSAEQNQSIINIAGTLESTAMNNGPTGMALTVNGQVQGGPKITVTGTLKGTATGIYQAGGSEITLDGATVIGTNGSGIVTKSGTLNLNNANVTGSGEYYSGEALSGQFGPTGAGIQIESYNPPYPGDITLNITNSTVTSSKGDAIQEYGDNTTQVLQAINLNGDVTLTPAEGKKALAIESSVGEQANSFKVTIDGNEVPNTTLTSAEGTFTTVEEPAPTPETPSEEAENPNTADPVSLYLTIAAVALLGLTATAVLAKKSRR